MAVARYNDILKDLKQKIESGEYPYRSLLPSENTLTGIFKCSRNTVRRAISILVKMGYVQSIHGKGVIIIYQPRKQAVFTIGQIESFQESARKNALDSRTEVIRFDELTVDQKMSAKSGFAVGSVVFYILRVRYVNNKAVILDVNMFLKSVMPELTREIVRAEEALLEAFTPEQRELYEVLEEVRARRDLREQESVFRAGVLLGGGLAAEILGRTDHPGMS